jgi:predicted transcriptional regulator
VFRENNTQQKEMSIMKRLISSFAVAILMMALHVNCEKSNVRADDTILDENSAVDKISSDIYEKHNLLKGKRIGIFSFTSLDGKEITEGKKFSAKLLESLMKKGDLRFVERSEIDKVINAQGFEQTGIVDPETVKESGKVLSIDVMISGNLARMPEYGELSVKAVDISSGEIYFASSVRFRPSRKFSNTEKNPKIVSLHRTAPDKIEMINRTFYILDKLSKQKPVGFLLAVIDKSDIETISKQNPNLSMELKRRKNIIQKNPELKKRILKLRRGVKLIRENEPERYDIIMKRKVELINRKGPMPGVPR